MKTHHECGHSACSQHYIDTGISACCWEECQVCGEDFNPYDTGTDMLCPRCKDEEDNDQLDTF